MADPDRSKERHTTRRALLAASLGGVGAWIAGALGTASPVSAADGDVVNVGDNLFGTKTTVFNVNTASYAALWGNATGTGVSVGVRGDTQSTHSDASGLLGRGINGVRGIGVYVGLLGEGSTGVHGIGDGTGVRGQSSTGSGVVGVSSSATGVLGISANHVAVAAQQTNNGTAIAGYSAVGEATIRPKPKTGVYGEAVQDSASRGVWGVSTAGQGVRGEATTGVAVSGVASDPLGFAFRGTGRVRFDKVSGVATIAAGATSVTVTPGVDISSDSFVLLTPRSNIGSRSLYFTTDATNNKITIRISSSRTSSTAVGWLLLR